MNKWEVFVNDLSELSSEEDLELSIRTLNEGRQKYTYKRVKARLSSRLDEFEDSLQVRFGRGQLADARFSIRVLGEVQRFPDKYR